MNDFNQSFVQIHFNPNYFSFFPEESTFSPRSNFESKFYQIINERNNEKLCVTHVQNTGDKTEIRTCALNGCKKSHDICINI